MIKNISLFADNLPYRVYKEINDLLLLMDCTILNDLAKDTWGELYLQGKSANKVFSISVILKLIVGSPVTYETNFIYDDTDLRSEFVRQMKCEIIKLMREAGVINNLPWGILTGVRPVKLAYKIKQDEGNRALEILTAKYLISQENAQLLTEVVERQVKILPTNRKSIAIYIHIPYCPSRCLYCSFPTGIMPKEDEFFQQNFCRSVEEDIADVVQLVSMHGLEVNSVYIGGGTPTSLSDQYFEILLAKVAIFLSYGQNVEFTVEAGRPDTFSVAKLNSMKKYGVDRISINPQTMNEKTLPLIGRDHSLQDIETTFSAVRASGIKYVNMDLIIGLPNETITDIRYSMNKLLEYEPANFTIHTLALKKGSPLYNTRHKYSFVGMNEVEALLDEITCKARELGYFPYYLYRQHYMLGQVANVGFAKKGAECLYNVWMMGEYGSVLGIGPGSSTKILQQDEYHLKKMYMPKNYFEYNSSLKKLLSKRAELVTARYEQGE